MNKNEELISTFYTAFQNKDFKCMQECYSDRAVFCDEAFVNLSANEVRAMWEMLISRSKDLKIEFKDVRADETRGSAEWTATYTFSKSNRKVVNKIRAGFVFEDGKIIRHDDHFDFYRWAKQALGFSGFLLGRTGFLRKKVQLTARFTLEEFMKDRKTASVLRD